MTNEEKAKEIVKETEDFFYHNEQERGLACALRMAKWKEQQMIDKACEWLKENIKDYLSCDGYSDIPGFRQYVTEDFYEDFKKAMEGGEK